MACGEFYVLINSSEYKSSGSGRDPKERDLSSIVRREVLRDNVHVVNRPPRQLPHNLGVVAEKER